MKVTSVGFACLAFLLLTACTARAPMPTVEQVDLERFMGDWYVIAHIPVYLEANAWNAVERYTLGAGGRRVNTEFTFNEGGFDGPSKAYYPTGFVKSNSGNAHWGMQFVWPIKSDYRIVYLSEGYDYTIIGRIKRDYVWVMSRQPKIDESNYARLVLQVESLGYDVNQLRRVPQQTLAQRRVATTAAKPADS